MERGVIYNRTRAQQIIDFSGLRFGNITPTDIDGLIEYKDQCFILIEAKHKDIELPDGQKLAFTRLCDSLSKPAILFVAEHETDGDIDASTMVVREYYLEGEWIKSKRDMMLREAIDNYLNWLG